MQSYLGVSFALMASLRSERSLAINGGTELLVEFHRTVRSPMRDERRIAFNILTMCDK